MKGGADGVLQLESRKLLTIHHTNFSRRSVSIDSITVRLLTNMQGSSSTSSLPDEIERHHEASPDVLPRLVQRSRRSQSYEPIPLKDRVYSTLCRFRYGWSFRSSVDIIGEVPIWLLGKCYHAPEKDRARYNSDIEGAPPHILAFMEHFNTVVWMTYRTNFPAISGTSITTDCGWGCMVRSGQMILATALDHYLLGAHWRLGTSSCSELSIHRQMLTWFADSPSSRCPFSMHALMHVAVRLGNCPGNWFGPSQLAVLISECVAEAREKHQLLANLLVYVARDCTVYVGDILSLYGPHPDRSILLLIPVRLGSEALNPIYIPCVKALLALDHCVGIIGGKPKHSVYFVGFQDNKLLHLDPHYCQAATQVPQDPKSKDFDFRTYHCHTPRKLTASRMDPSCTIGFLCPTLHDFNVLRINAEKILAPPLQKGVYPFFSFTDQCLSDVLNISVDTRMISDDPLHFMGFMLEEEDELKSLQMQKGSKVGWRRKAGEGLEGFSFSDDEDFVVVECKKSANQESRPVPIISTTTAVESNKPCRGNSFDQFLATGDL